MAKLRKAWGVAETGCQRAAVIGAGNMGAGIAAQFANAGIEVDLLDMPAAGAARNARAEAGIANQINAGGFMGAGTVALVHPGNIEDDLSRLAKADWIVEAVIEDLAIKQALYARIEPLLQPDAILSSNTSTIPRAALVAERGAGFADQFVISHFFNPPRYMPLLELVAPHGSKAGASAAQVGRVALGKTVIECRDTPGFIANRIGCTWMSIAMVEAIRLGLSIEQADMVHTAFGVPRTGVFGLADLVGVDLIPHVWGSLMRALPGGDTINRFDLPGLPLVQSLISSGRLGRKSGAGFYRKSSTGAAEVIDTVSGTYKPATGFSMADLPGSGTDLEALLADETGLGAYARSVLGEVLRYVQDHAAAIAQSGEDVDKAMELGYAWRKGPFKLRDSLSDAALASLDLQRAPVMAPSFTPRQTDRLSRAKALGQPIAANPSAALWDIGDGLACLEIETKMNTIDAAVLDMLETALDALGGHKALVIGNQNARAFSAGANLAEIARLIEAESWAKLARFTARGQLLFARLRKAPVPVVAAIKGVALGGGCELALHCTATVSHSETRIALPEHLVGLLPAWGGCTRLLARAQALYTGPEQQAAALSHVFQALCLARPAGSAREAAEWGFLDPAQPIVMQAEDTLEAAASLSLQLAENYMPPSPARLQIEGASAAKELMAPAQARQAAGDFSAADLAVITRIAFVLTGGTAAAGDVDETYLRDLEREAFAKAARDPMTLLRVRHMLATGKPLKM